MKLIKILRRSKGVSLIEMLVVIGILAFVMSIVARNVSQSRKKSDLNKTRILMGVIEQAAQEFELDCGYYPESLEDLVEDSGECEEWGPSPYLKNRKSLQDTWKQDFVYNYDADTGVIELISYGADRKPGGSGRFNKDISSLD